MRKICHSLWMDDEDMRLGGSRRAEAEADLPFLATDSQILLIQYFPTGRQYSKVTMDQDHLAQSAMRLKASAYPACSVVRTFSISFPAPDYQDQNTCYQDAPKLHAFRNSHPPKIASVFAIHSSET